MAEGLLRQIYGDKYEVYSAGTSPTQINPLAVAAMAEIGADISKQYSKSIDAFKETEIDLAISVCQSSAKTLCTLCNSPMSMGKPAIITARLHKTKNYVIHGFQDPSEAEGTEEEKHTVFRKSREEIKKWITEYFAEPTTINKK